MSVETEYALRKDIRNNPLLREIDTRQRGELRHYALLVLLSVLLVLFSAWQRQRVLALTTEVESLRQQRTAALENSRKLLLNQESFNSPQLVERGARSLGLRPPSLGETLVIERAPDTPVAPGVVAQVR